MYMKSYTCFEFFNRSGIMLGYSRCTMHLFNLCALRYCYSFMIKHFCGKAYACYLCFFHLLAEKINVIFMTFTLIL